MVQQNTGRGDSQVGIVTRYGLYDLGFKPGLEQEFSPSPHQWSQPTTGTGALLWEGVKTERHYLPHASPRLRISKAIPVLPNPVPFWQVSERPLPLA